STAWTSLDGAGLNAGGALCRSPVAVAEVVNVEVATRRRRDHKRRARLRGQLIEGGESVCLQRHRAKARLRLRRLDAAVAKGAPDVPHLCTSVDVTALKREPLA